MAKSRHAFSSNPDKSSIEIALVRIHVDREAGSVAMSSGPWHVGGLLCYRDIDAARAMVTGSSATLLSRASYSPYRGSPAVRTQSRAYAEALLQTTALQWSLAMPRPKRGSIDMDAWSLTLRTRSLMALRGPVTVTGDLRLVHGHR